jgi:hypothetical protein
MGLAGSDRAIRMSISFPDRTALPWGFAVLCVIFFWTLVSVSSQVSPSVFPVLARGAGLQEYPTSFTLVSQFVDQLLLVVSATAILLILELRLRSVGIGRRILLAIPALLIIFFFLLPSVFLMVGGLGTTVLIFYLVYEGEALLEVSPGKALSSILVILAATVAVVSVVSAARWVSNAVDGVMPFSDSTWGPSIFLMKLLNQSYWLLPRMLLLLFLAWAVRLVLGLYWDDVQRFISGISAHFGASAPSGEPFVPVDMAFYMVLASLLGAGFVGAYPYLPRINPALTLVGYDVRTFYLPSAQLMLNLSPLQALAYAFKGDRAIMLVLQYATAELTGSADFAARVVPALMALLLTISTYYFVKSGFKDQDLAATASIFAAFSFVVVAGINAGLDANWLAASEALLLFSALLLGLDSSDAKYVILSLVPSIMLLLTHEWTWLIIMTVLVTYAVFTGVRALVTREREGLRFELTAVVFVLIVNFAADGIRRLAGGISGVQNVTESNAAASLSLLNLPKVVGSLQSTVSIFLVGALDNPLVVFLAIVGVLAISDTYGRMNRLLLAWVAVASVGILFAGFSLGFFQARVVLLTPIPVLAAMGFVSILRYATNLMSQGWYTNRRLAKAFVVMAYMSLFALLICLALQNVGFLYTGT